MPPKKVEIGKYRRNGKLQACEPCRRGKLACDHAAPYCGRCVRRKTTSKCIYHPAPMTRTRAAGNQPTGQQAAVSDSSGQLPSPQSSVTLNTPYQPQSDPAPSKGKEHPERSHCSLLPSSEATTQQRATRSHGSAPKYLKDGWQNMVFRRSAQYYGPTSFSAIFSEHQPELNEDLLDMGEDSRKHPGAWKFGQPLLGRERFDSPTVREKQTVKALLNIPSRKICESLLNKFFNGSIRELSLDPIMMNHFISTLWSTFEAELDAPRSTEVLTAIAGVLFRNEETPLASTPDDGIEWLDTFMGPNIRFEIMGLFFCYLGLSYLSLLDSDPLFTVPENFGRDRKQTAWRMRECADVCLRMCDYSETVNYLVTALILCLKRLETGCTGDDTYNLRRLHGDLITATITSGLHRLPEYGTKRVTSVSEYKRRLFSAIYCNDKTHASLNGTPPLLTRLYCSVEPCLDLPNNALFLPREELDLAISDLDAQGWKTSTNEYYSTTLLRAKVQISSIREEILELALGVNVDGSEDRIRDLHHRNHQMFYALPPQLHYYSEEKIPKESTGESLYNQAHFFLQHLQNKFLIDRVAIARGYENGQGLIDTAMEMIDISLMLWIKRDLLMDYTYLFDWIITYYGIPSAGVLCIELLKTSAGQSTLQFSRADAIQKLTLFIAFLEWVRPTDGNFALAQRLRKVLRRVLSHVLEPSQNLFCPTAEVPPDPIFASFDNLNDLDWLNTIDWTQGSWMDFN